MEKEDYDTLLRHSDMLKKTVTILDNLSEFGSVAELEMLRSIIQHFRTAISEMDDTLAKIDAKRRNVLVMRQRIDRIIGALSIPIVVLIAFLNLYRYGHGSLLISFFAILLLLVLSLLKSEAVTFIEILAIIAIGGGFIATMYVSKAIQGFVTSYSAEISAVSLLYALALPWFAKLAHKTK